MKDIEKNINETENIKISIVIPVFNVENYLKECILSIQKQKINDIEIICVEDCSTDKSYEILKQCAADDKRIKIIKHETNMGLSCARNSGMQAAQGKYLMFVDSDDMLAENALMELYNYAEEKMANGLLFNMKTVYEGKAAKERYEGITIRSDDIEERIYNKNELLIAFAKKKIWKMEVWRYFWNRKALQNQDIQFFPELIHEDNLFSFYIWVNMDRIAYIKKEYYVYRKRDNSIMFSMNYHYVESMFIIFNEIYSYWKNNSMNEETEKAIREYLDIIYEKMQKLRGYFLNYQPLSIGNAADAYLFEKMWSMRQVKRKYAFLNEDKTGRLKRAEKVIIYGAGTVGIETISLLEEKNIKIDAVAVTNKSNNLEQIRGYHVEKIDNLVKWKDKAIVLLAAVERHHGSMIDKLKELGFKNIISFNQDSEI